METREITFQVLFEASAKKKQFVANLNYAVKSVEIYLIILYLL